VSDERANLLALQVTAALVFARQREQDWHVTGWFGPRVFIETATQKFELTISEVAPRG
jgi:hypothetical protein